MAHDRYISLEEIAAVLRVSHVTAWRAVKSGEIPGGLQVNGPNSAWRVDQREFKTFLAKSRKPAEQAEDPDEFKAR